MKIVDVSVVPGIGVQVVTESRRSPQDVERQVTRGHPHWNRLYVAAQRILPPLVGRWKLVSVDERLFLGGLIQRQFSWVEW